MQSTSTQVPHHSVSRRHAAIVHREDLSFIYDLGSTQGTFVDDTAIEAHEPVQLASGSTIRFGEAKKAYKFLVREQPKPTAQKRAREEGKAKANPYLSEEGPGRKQARAALQPGQAVAYDPLSAIFGKRPRATENHADGVYDPNAAAGNTVKDFSWATPGYLR